MLEFNPIALIENEVPLKLDIPAVKGGSKITSDSKELLPGRITLGTPVAVLLTQETVKGYPETAAFLVQEQEFVFYLVHLACTFHPQDSEPFIEAWLRVRLRRDDDKAMPRVIAWSMTPQKEEDTKETSKALKLETNLKFVLADVKVGGEIGTKTPQRHVFLSAYGLQEHEPYWHFRRTDQRDLEGAFRLALIVRSPRDTLASALVEMRAQIQRKTLGIFPYATPIDPPPPGLSFAFR